MINDKDFENRSIILMKGISMPKSVNLQIKCNYEK